MYGDELPNGWQKNKLREDDGKLTADLITAGAEDILLITWQTGTVPDGGPNGVQLEHVIQLCIERLQELNQKPFDCRENSLAITYLEIAQHWLYRRTRDRQLRGVEGTNQP